MAKAIIVDRNGRMSYSEDAWVFCMMCGKMIRYKNAVKAQYSEEGTRHYFWCSEDHMEKWESYYEEDETVEEK